MYFKSIFTHNYMPVQKRDTDLEFVKLHSTQLLTKGPNAQCAQLVKTVAVH